MRVLCAVAMLVVGCAADPDGDGLTSSEERALGLDPEVADTDGDGMPDGDEVAAGTDPLNADTDGDRLLDGLEGDNGADPLQPDTDGDGYLDGDEVSEGKDPADADSVIYTGGWPYYHAKDDLPKQRGGDAMEVGQRFRRYTFTDQNGDELDLFDFYNDRDAYILIDVSTEWCSPCNWMASVLAGQEEVAEWQPLLAAVAAGELYWITILGQTNDGQPADLDLLHRWEEAYPNDRVPLMADPGTDLNQYIELSGWPTVFLLRPDLKTEATEGSVGSWFGVIDHALDIYEQR